VQPLANPNGPQLPVKAASVAPASLDRSQGTLQTKARVHVLTLFIYSFGSQSVQDFSKKHWFGLFALQKKYLICRTKCTCAMWLPICFNYFIATWRFIYVTYFMHASKALPANIPDGVMAPHVTRFNQA